MRIKGTINKPKTNKEIIKVCQNCENSYKTNSMYKKYCDDCTKLRQRMANWSYGRHPVELRNFLKKEQPNE
jgi:protein-arginine kinase activator protein McsA